MSVKLSFIIPVYNVADYLEECVESILSQMDGNCEILLIDDGSTDASGTMCDHFAAQSSLIRAFHQANAGASAARNLGIAEAKGEYIAFVDSDDRITGGSVREILAWIDQGGADLCFMQADKLYPDGARQSLGDDIHRDGVQGKTQQEVLRYLATRPKYPGSACTKLFRRAFLEAHGLRFPVGRKEAEDLSLVMNCLMNASTYDALMTPYYEYRQNRTGSATHVIKPETFAGRSMFITEAVHLLTDDGVPRSEAARSALSLVAHSYSVLLWQRSMLQRSLRKEADAFLRSFQWILAYGAAGKTRLIGKAVRAVGIAPASWLLRAYMTLRNA